MRAYKGIFVFFVALLAYSSSVMAQQTQNVTLNSTHEYTANLQAGTTAKEYIWVLLDDANNKVLDAKFSAEKNEKVSIDFLAANFVAGKVYTLQSQVKDNNDCLSEVVEVAITVLGAGNVMFADANTNDNSVTCSLITGDTPTGTTFDVVFSGGVAPYELTYEVTDHAGVKTTHKQTFPTNAGTVSVNDWENTTNVQQTATITLISALTKDGQNVPVISTDATNITGKNNIRTLKVHPKPVITNLTLN